MLTLPPAPLVPAPPPPEYIADLPVKSYLPPPEAYAPDGPPSLGLWPLAAPFCAPCPPAAEIVVLVPDIEVVPPVPALLVVLENSSAAAPPPPIVQVTVLDPSVTRALE